jgi:hypothetical protein
MPLLLLLLLPLLLLALWLVLLPLSLWLRFRSGRARRRVQPWVVRLNAWLLTASVPVFLASSWFASRWWPDALADAAIGLLVGVLAGFAGLWTMRIERDARGLWVTPNRWLVLALTTLVALRVLAGLWRAWLSVVQAGTTALPALEAGLWTGVAGLLLGYGIATAWGLRARLRRWTPPA